MSLFKKDFKQIANIIKDTNGLNKLDKDILIREFADFCLNQNKDFNYNMFVKACE